MTTTTTETIARSMHDDALDAFRDGWNEARKARALETYRRAAVDVDVALRNVDAAATYLRTVAESVAYIAERLDASSCATATDAGFTATSNARMLTARAQLAEDSALAYSAALTVAKVAQRQLAHAREALDACAYCGTLEGVQYRQRGDIFLCSPCGRYDGAV